jgi:hypothetical protein
LGAARISRNARAVAFTPMPRANADGGGSIGRLALVVFALGGQFLPYDPRNKPAFQYSLFVEKLPAP